MMTTIQDIINALEKVEDKTKPIWFIGDSYNWRALSSEIEIIEDDIVIREDDESYC